MAEKRVIELEIQDNTKTLKQQYKEAVLEVQKLADAYGETSKEVSQAAKRAAELKDKIEDTNDAIAAFKGEGKFVATAKALSSVANGFSAVEGAMGLIGVESEKLQETMLKVQSAMALAQGLEGLEDAGRAFKQLGAVAVESLKGVKGALLATGIGVFIVALGTVVAYWDDIKEAVSGVSEEQEKLNKLSHDKFEVSKEELSNLDAQDNILKLQGKSEREILNLKIAKVNTAIELGKIELENVIRTNKAEEKAAIQNYNLTKKVVDLIVNSALFLPKLMLMPIDLAIKGANKISEALGMGKLVAFDMGKTIDDMQDKFSGFIAGSLFNVEELKAEGKKEEEEIRKQLRDLENQKAGFQQSIKEMNKQGSSDAIENRKSELDALIELEIRKANTDEKILTDLLNKRLELEKLKGAQLEVAQQDNAEKIRKAIEEDNSEIIKLETKKITDLKVLSDSRLETLQGGLDAEYEAEKAAAEKRQLILDVQAIRARQAEEKAQSFKVNAVKQGLETIASITELFGKKSEKAARKAFQVQKAAQMASALITTYQNATAAYASQFLPIPDPSSPVRGGIAAGLAVAAGLTNVAKIATQKFEGGGATGGGSAPSGGGGGGQMTTPNFSVIGSSGVNQLAQIQQKPTRAYVVSGDVANGLSLERNRLQNATFEG
jgi:hypothetical protein